MFWIEFGLVSDFGLVRNKLILLNLVVILLLSVWNIRKERKEYSIVGLQKIQEKSGNFEKIRECSINKAFKPDPADYCLGDPLVPQSCAAAAVREASRRTIRHTAEYFAG